MADLRNKRRHLVPAGAAGAAALAAAIFLVVMQAAAPGGEPTRADFLGDLLGSPDPSAPVVELEAKDADASAALALEGAAGGAWRRFVNGVTRPTAYGAETIVVDGATKEQFLTVGERQGLRTWRWRIESNRTPRVGDDGGVAFLDPKTHKLTDISIAPVKIFDAERKDVTPAGLRWNVERSAGSWWLTLRVHDANLPLPYIIDPAITHRNTQTGTTAAGTSVTVTKPTGVQANDLLVAELVVGANVTPTASGWTL